MHGIVGIADTPKLLRISKVESCNIVKAIALCDEMFSQKCYICTIGHKTPTQIADSTPLSATKCRGFYAIIPTSDRKHHQTSIQNDLKDTPIFWRLAPTFVLAMISFAI